MLLVNDITLGNMGLDIAKIKVKKDSKDVQLKAQQLFKKATTAMISASKSKPTEKASTSG